MGSKKSLKTADQKTRQRIRTANNKLRAIDRALRATRSEHHQSVLKQRKAVWLSSTSIKASAPTATTKR